MPTAALDTVPRQQGVGFSVGPGDLRGPSENFMVLWMISNRKQEKRVEGETLGFGMACQGR